MTVLFDDQTLFGEDQSSGSILKTPGSGVGISTTPKRSSTDLVQAELNTMSPLQRVGTALSEFGAGVSGRPSPLRARVQERRRDELLQIQETKGFLDDLENLGKLTQGMEDGPKGDLVDTVASKWEAVRPGYGAAVKAVGARPSLLSNFQQYMSNLPVPVQELAKRDPQAFLKFAGTAEGVKMLNQAADQPVLRTAGIKRDTLIMGWQKLVAPEKVERFMKDGVLTDAEIMEAQGDLPEKLRFSPEEREAIGRHRVFWEGTGVLHGDKAQEVLADRAKKSGKVEEVKEPKTEHIGGKVYQWDPDKKVQGTRLTTDPRYVELGASKEEGKPGALDRDTVQTELKLSDDWRQDTKKFSERRPMFESVTSYMADRSKSKTSSGDAALAFAYAKMRDPNDRLAVSETRDLVKLGNIFERIGVNITGVLDKGETIPDRVASQMYDEIRRNFSEQNRAQGQLEKQYRDKVKAYGGEPTRVMGAGLAIPEDQLKPSGNGGGAPKGEGQEFADPGQVRAAFQAGKISRDQAKAALKKFGFQ